ncbi:MAG: hypothetical protein GYB25_10265 [Rhodobacteraceae bacterium]|nr:hypothetical protein [Paracoccaceae bacterium]
MNAMADGLIGKPALRARLGFEPGLVLRMHGMRRSGNHAIASWLQRNAPEGRALFLNNCRRSANPLDAFSSVEVNDAKVSVDKVQGDLSVLGPDVGDGGLLLVSYEDNSPAQDRPRKPLSGHFDRGVIDHEVLVYRSFLNWAASLTKKLEPNESYSVARRIAVILRGVDLYSDLLGEVIDGGAAISVCYDRWMEDEAYRADLLARLGLEARDNSLGPVTGYGGGSSFQKGALESAELATDRRYVEMMQDPLYQAVLQVAARDAVLVARIQTLFPRDAEVLARVAMENPIKGEVAP